MKGTAEFVWVSCFLPSTKATSEALPVFIALDHRGAPRGEGIAG